MANTFYDSYLESLLGTDVHSRIAIASDNLKVIFVDHADVTPNYATHQDHADLAAGIVATSGNLTGKTITDGVFDCDDFTVNSVTGDQFESLQFYKDSGTSSTSPLMFGFDTATGLPFTPSGGNITVTINASGVATL